eukprot:gene10647-12593_t
MGAERIALDLPLDYSQDDVPAARMRITRAILDLGTTLTGAPPPVEQGQSADLAENRSDAWNAFKDVVSGEWSGYTAEFDSTGAPLDFPLRYVHGVGKVPSKNMPFREKVFQSETSCTSFADHEGLTNLVTRQIPQIGSTDSYRSADLPEQIGTEDSLGSCGGAECPANVEETRSALRGRDECKTILRNGSYSAGPKVLEEAPEDGAHFRVEHCLAGAYDRRVRVVQNVEWAWRNEAAGYGWKMASFEVHLESRKGSLQGLLSRPVLDLEDDLAGAWAAEEEDGAAYAIGAGDQLMVAARAPGAAHAWAPSLQAVGFPGGVWCYMQHVGDELLVEAGWLAGPSVRHSSARYYVDSHLDLAALG